MKELAARLYHLVDRLTHWVWFLAPVCSRAMVGMTFVYTGYAKTHQGHDKILGLLTSLNIPFPALNAWFLGYLEWFGAYLIMVGLFTRPIAFAQMISMAVAVMTADRSDFLSCWGSSGDKGPTDITTLVLFCYLIWLVMFGAGPLSIDYILGRFFRQWAGIEQKPVKD
ncbi:MAG TPA: DoxX family protein [Candidatus Xenobia bacterium]